MTASTTALWARPTTTPSAQNSSRTRDATPWTKSGRFNETPNSKARATRALGDDCAAGDDWTALFKPFLLSWNNFGGLDNTSVSQSESRILRPGRKHESNV